MPENVIHGVQEILLAVLADIIDASLADDEILQFVLVDAGIPGIEPYPVGIRRAGPAQDSERRGVLEHVPQAVEIRICHAVGVDEDALVIGRQVEDAELVGKRPFG